LDLLALRLVIRRKIIFVLQAYCCLVSLLPFYENSLQVGYRLLQGARWVLPRYRYQSYRVPRDPFLRVEALMQPPT
jgi:hypothetical protein